MASDLGVAACWSQATYAYPRFSIGFFAFLAFDLSCLIAFLRLSSEAGLATAWPPAVRNGLVFSKAISLETLHVLARRSRAFFTSLNLPQR